MGVFHQSELIDRLANEREDLKAADPYSNVMTTFPRECPSSA